jgi:hypothetical protein
VSLHTIMKNVLPRRIVMDIEDAICIAMMIGFYCSAFALLFVGCHFVVKYW